MTKQSRRIGIIVAGMHRSGTSALAKAIAIQGAELPKQILGPAAGNPLGHWEPAALLELNDRFLFENGSNWKDWKRLDIRISAARLEYFTTTILDELNNNYGKHRLIVLKEPRICRFIPFYEAILQRAGIVPLFVLPYRHPDEVAQSLAHRDGIPIPYAKLLWARHVLDSEFATRGSPRAFVGFDHLMDDPAACLAVIARKLDFQWPRRAKTARKELQEFLRPELRHFRFSVEAREEFVEINAYVHEIHANLERLRNADNDGAVLADLDRLKFKLDNPSAEFLNAAQSALDVHPSATANASNGRKSAKPSRWTLPGIWIRTLRTLGLRAD